jgi:hypothetical protein
VGTVIAAARPPSPRRPLRRGTGNPRSARWSGRAGGNRSSRPDPSQTRAGAVDIRPAGDFLRLRNMALNIGQPVAESESSPPVCAEFHESVSTAGAVGEDLPMRSASPEWALKGPANLSAGPLAPPWAGPKVGSLEGATMFTISLPACSQRGGDVSHRRDCEPRVGLETPLRARVLSKKAAFWLAGRHHYNQNCPAHAAAQLRYTSSGGRNRHSGDPGPARNSSILPANTGPRERSIMPFTRAVERRCRSNDD